MITNCKIVRVNADARDYHAEPIPRGHKDFVMSKSQLLDFMECPSRWKEGYESEATIATKRGEVWDCMVLQPEQFEQRFAVKPITYPAPSTHAAVKKGRIEVGSPLPWNRNADFCDEWELEQEKNGRIVISTALAENVRRAREIVMDDALCAPLFEGADFQVEVRGIYTSQQAGLHVPLKGLIDIVPRGLINIVQDFTGHPGCLVDFKTAADASPRRWFRSAFGFGYHVQAALYLDLFNATNPDVKRDQFLHIVQETTDPFQVGRRAVSADVLDLGRSFYVAALERYCECLKTGIWPSYDVGWTTWELEPYMITQR